MTETRFVFTHAGREYTLAPWREWPLSVMLDIERGAISGLAEVFPPGEFDQLVDDGFTIGQLTDVIDAANRAALEAKEAAEAEAQKNAARRPILPWRAKD